MPRLYPTISLVSVSSMLLVCGFVVIESAGAQDPPAEPSPQVDFARDIAPLFAQNCTACHNAKKPEGGLNLETHASLILGGDSGQAVVASDLDGSSLLARVVDTEDPMPPTDNAVGAKRLSKEQVELLRRWILAGAAASETKLPASIVWQRIPEQLAPIYAVDSSADGNYVAVGRGNSVEIKSASAPTSPPPQQILVDPSLRLTDGTQLQGAHLDIVQSVAFSPDSQLLATGGYRDVKIWRRQTAAHELLSGLSNLGTVAAVNSTQTRIAFATTVNGIELVDVASGQSHRFLKAHAAPVTAMLWLSPNILLSCDESGGWVLTRADTYQKINARIQGTDANAKQLVALAEQVYAISSDGKLFELTTAANDLRTQTFEADVVFRQREIPLTTGATAMAAVEHAASQLLVALDSGAIVVVDPVAGNVSREWSTGSPLRSMTVSPDQTMLATVPVNGPVKLWTIASGALLASFESDYVQSQELRTRQRNVTRQQSLIEQLAAKVPELKKASDAEVEAQKKVQETRDKAAEELKTKATELEVAQAAMAEIEQSLSAAQAAAAEAAKIVEELKAQIQAKKKAASEAQGKKSEAEAELAKREQALATALDSVKRAADLIPDMESRLTSEKKRLLSIQELVQSIESQPSVPPALACAFSSDNFLSIVAGSDHTLRLYANTDGRALANLSGAGAATSLHTNAQHMLYALSQDGRLVAWDLSLPWSLERTFGTADESPFSDRVTALDFSPNGRLLAVGSGPPSRFGDIKLVDMTTGRIAKDLGEAHSDSVLSLKFSPDGRTLASGGADKLCRLWNVETGELQRTLEGHTHHVLGIAWQDNGQQLATAGADNTVKLWKVDVGEQRLTISDFKKEVAAVRFVGQTSQLFTVSADSSVKLSNTDNGKTIRSYSGASDALYAATVTADGKRIIVGGQAGKLWSWQVEDAKLLESSDGK